MQAGRSGKRSPRRTPAQRRAATSVAGARLTGLAMPRCTVRTAGALEEPPLCTEGATCRKGETKEAGRLGGVSVGVGVGERPPWREAGGRRAAGRGLDPRAGAHRSSSQTGSRKAILFRFDGGNIQKYATLLIKCLPMGHFMPASFINGWIMLLQTIIIDNIMIK